MTTATFPALVNRLNDLSVTKRFEAFRDVEWNAPDSAIDRRDPRLRLTANNPLGGTAWYRTLAPDLQSALGLDWTSQILRFGIAFESCLSQGLLRLARTQPNRSSTYRYAMHEVIEESHHSLMFQEFINRSGCDPHDVSKLESCLQGPVAGSAVSFPELFFFCVLSGEVFIDHDNRQRLRDRDGMHPLLRRVIQIHVTEEARHVCFAEGYLREHLPLLPSWKRRVLDVAVPLILKRGELLMLRPPPSIVARYAIPSRALEEAFGAGSAHEGAIREIVAPITSLLRV